VFYSNHSRKCTELGHGQTDRQTDGRTPAILNAPTVVTGHSMTASLPGRGDGGPALYNSGNTL